MKVLNVINNNVVSSLDEKNREIVVMGKGIGFHKKPGEEIADNQVEKVFRLPDETHDRFMKLVQDISYTHMKLASDIIDYACEHVGRKLRKSIYVTLTDHLDFAIQREKQGMVFQNALLWEVKEYYVKEYEVGKMAQKLVKEREGVALSDDEAAFIALHIINAEEDTDEKKDVKFLNLTRDILTIVQDDLELDFKDESIDYRRFMTHLKFFIQRAVKKDYSYGDDTADVYNELVKKCPGEYACAADIKKYVKDKLDYEASEEELIYLTVHLHRLTKCSKKQSEQEN